MLFATSASLLLALALTPQAGGEDAAANAEQAESVQQEQANDEEKVRCRYEHLVNTRIPQRICRTESEWARIAIENREANANNARNRGARGEGGASYGAESTGGI